jgi:hypothetical protein
MAKADQIAQELAKEITSLLLSLIPGVSQLQVLLPNTAKTLVDQLFTGPQEQSLASEVQTIAGRVANDVIAGLRTELGPKVMGANLSALDDLRVTIRKTDISPQMLIQSNLDPNLLVTVFAKNCPEEHLKWASTQRRQVYGKALGLFSFYLVNAAPSLPGFDVAINQAVLSKLSQISAAIVEIQAAIGAGNAKRSVKADTGEH